MRSSIPVHIVAVTLAAGVLSAPADAQRRAVESRGTARTSVNVNEHRDVNVNRNVNVNHNVNVNRDVDVHVDNHYAGSGYGCCYHPVATAAAVTTAAVVTGAVIGSIVHSLPPSCTAVSIGAVTYQQCGSTWYQPQFSGTTVNYVVVNPPR